jgi:hypothetical protein
MAATERSFHEEFFPTPAPVVRRMIGKVSKNAVNFLEPSAGKGALAEGIKAEMGESGFYGRDRRFGHHAKIDCVEIDPDLVRILRGKEFTVVGFDWLTYYGVCYYDAIVMNPPFSSGATHLLRAWDFLHHGEIVCLLNQETVANPHTEERKRLVSIIEKHGSWETLGQCFSSGAARGTDVTVAMVYLKKEAKDDVIDVWATPTSEKPVNDQAGPEATMLAIKDELGNMEHYYNMANDLMLQSFTLMRKACLFMEANRINSEYHANEREYKDIVAGAMSNVHVARAEWARKHRADAWKAVFDRMEFRKWIDSKQYEQLLRDLQQEAHIPFTADNIKATLDNVMLNRRKLFEQSAANVFDALTRHHKENTVTEGWKSNDNYKVNKRIVWPWGVNFCPILGFRTAWGRGEMDVYHDLDRVLAILKGGTLDDVRTIGAALEHGFKLYRKEPAKIESTFFEIRYFKKGTVHLVWKDMKLLQDFNQLVAAGKKWLGSDTQGNHKPTPTPEQGSLVPLED